MAKREMKTQNTEAVKVVQIKNADVEVTEAVVTENKKPTGITKGIVVDCEKLNIRKAPKKDSEVPVAIIDKGSKVTIDEDKSTDDWYRVKTEKNVWGFCMKKYVKIG